MKPGIVRNVLVVTRDHTITTAISGAVGGGAGALTALMLGTDVERGAIGGAAIIAGLANVVLTVKEIFSFCAHRAHDKWCKEHPEGQGDSPVTQEQVELIRTRGREIVQGLVTEMRDGLRSVGMEPPMATPPSTPGE